MEITKRGKAYARLELVSESDRYDEVLKTIEELPEPKGNKRSVAKSYKSFIYGKGDNNT